MKRIYYFNEQNKVAVDCKEVFLGGMLKKDTHLNDGSFQLT